MLICVAPTTETALAQGMAGGAGVTGPHLV